MPQVRIPAKSAASFLFPNATRAINAITNIRPSNTETLPICTSRHIAHCKTGEKQKRIDGTWDDAKSKDGTIPPRKSFCFEVARDEVAGEQGPRYDPNRPCQGNRNSCVPLKTFCRIGTPTPVPTPKPKPRPIPSRCSIFDSRLICEAAQCTWEESDAPCPPGFMCQRAAICRDPDPYQGPVPACRRTKTTCNSDDECERNTPDMPKCEDIEPVGSRNNPKYCTNGSSACKGKCLSSFSRIATPIHDVPVTSLKVGDIVWTTDAAGNRVVRPIIKVSRVSAPNHRVVNLVLADGRSLDVSALHPAAGGIVVGDLQIGDVYDGSTVQSLAVKPYEGTATYDILPAGDTGYYWVNGILMGSTLK